MITTSPGMIGIEALEKEKEKRRKKKEKKKKRRISNE